MVKLNKIYTRTGDGGTAGLVDGSRVAKNSARMQAIGEVDEANSAVGVALTLVADGAHRNRLQVIQNELFDLGADIATPGDIDGALRISAAQVERLEREIDAMNADLEPLTSFILPGGSQAAAAGIWPAPLSAAPSGRWSRSTSRNQSTATRLPM